MRKDEGCQGEFTSIHSKERTGRFNNPIDSDSHENPPGNEKVAAQFLRPLLSRWVSKPKSFSLQKGGGTSWLRKDGGEVEKAHLQWPPGCWSPLGKPLNGDIPLFKESLPRERSTAWIVRYEEWIASFIHALSAMERSKIPLHQGAVILHLVSDEESHGHQGMGFLTQRERIQGDAALVGEPTDLQPVIAQKGALWLRILTIGKSAHGSKPHLGVNAVEKMMKLIERLRILPLEKDHPLLGKTNP